jgi:transposase-like protein
VGKTVYSEEDRRRGLAVLAEEDGNITRAADRLGVPRKTVSDWANQDRQDSSAAGDPPVDDPPGALAEPQSPHKKKAVVVNHHTVPSGGTVEEPEAEPDVDPAALKDRLRARLGLPPGDPFVAPGPSAAPVDPPPADDPPPATADRPTVLSILRQGKPAPTAGQQAADSPGPPEAAPPDGGAQPPDSGSPPPAPKRPPRSPDDLAWTVAGVGEKGVPRDYRPQVRYNFGRIRLSLTLDAHAACDPEANISGAIHAGAHAAGQGAIVDGLAPRLPALPAVEGYRKLLAELEATRHAERLLAAQVCALEAQRTEVALARRHGYGKELVEIDRRLADVRQERAARQAEAEVLDAERPPTRFRAREEASAAAELVRQDVVAAIREEWVAAWGQVCKLAGPLLGRIVVLDRALQGIMGGGEGDRASLALLAQMDREAAQNHPAQDGSLNP